ncbi:uracil-DNA glycosylase [Euzebya tangerina]|uniref:uracil-DNA glycosylase n=1 Tax=Euzebya tangerina TaxID=591198 RepID=UPI001F0C606A|nr:uracil-DNA glycosylase [Euzebya tangerina]
MSASSDSLAQVGSEVSTCRACPRLVDWREEVAAVKRKAFADQTYWGRGVPGFGDPEAKLLVLGLAPAAHGANRTGRMFTGDRSGDFLYAALHRAGLANQATSVARDDGLELDRVWITSPVKCAPPKNKPTAAERDTCAPYLHRELELLEPRVILCLGRFAWDGALIFLGRPSPKPVFGHGAVADVTVQGRPDLTLVGSYHVSQQNTFTGRLTEDMFDRALGTALELAYPAQP